MVVQDDAEAAVGPYDLSVKAYGIGMCPVDADVLACLRSRATGDIVFFCPLCGCAFRTPPPSYELDEIQRLDELAPAGVVIASREEIVAAGFQGAIELDQTWVRWVKEVLWRKPPEEHTDEEATKIHFDRWYGRRPRH